MPLHKGCPRQAGLAGCYLDHGGSRGPFAAEGNDQDRIPAVAEISLVEGNDQHPVADWRVAQIRRPYFAPAWQWVIRQS